MAGLDDVDLEKISPAELKKLIDADPRVIAAKRDVAEQAAAEWRTIVPPNIDSGDYNDSIEVRQNGTNVSVGASDFKAHWLEYGTEDTPEFAPRRKVEEKFNKLDINIEL